MRARFGLSGLLLPLSNAEYVIVSSVSVSPGEQSMLSRRLAPVRMQGQTDWSSSDRMGRRATIGKRAFDKRVANQGRNFVKSAVVATSGGLSACTSSGNNPHRMLL